MNGWHLTLRSVYTQGGGRGGRSTVVVLPLSPAEVERCPLPLPIFPGQRETCCVP